ncbi:MAG: translation initiation factor IF-2 subunit beta [Candidatus Altiarchaeota archaeon]
MDSFDYKGLLDRADANLPEKLKKHDRFELPEADIFVEGNQTIIKNFNEVSTSLNRKPIHVFKFLLKELAAPGTLDGSRVVIQRVLRRNIINQRIEDYAKEFVLCHECGRPDTKVTSLEGEKIVKCEACGGWWPLRRIK